MSIVLLDAVESPVSGSAIQLKKTVTYCTVQVIATGSPAAVDVELEGSLDGTNYSALATHSVSLPADIFHVAGKPVTHVRGKLTNLSGGTSPTVTMLFDFTRDQNAVKYQV